MFDCHCEHVDEDGHHDGHIELLIGHQVEKEERAAEVGLWNWFLGLFRAELLHGVVVLLLVLGHEQLLGAGLVGVMIACEIKNNKIVIIDIVIIIL